VIALEEEVLFMASLDAREVRRRALLAASKVSLSAVLVTGCGGQVEAPVSDPSANAGVGGAASVADAAAPDAARDCAVLVQSALADAGESVPYADPALTACCQEVLPRWNFGDEAKISYEAARACCEVVAGEKWWELGHPACTPWGPPMPPAFDDHAHQGIA
jgi:hypothetical protein